MELFPPVILFTNDLASGAINNWFPVDGGSTPAPVPIWPYVDRVYCGGDQGSETKITGIDSAGIPVGAVRVFELGDASHGPITIIPYSHAEASTSLGRNRIVTPGPTSLPYTIPQGGVFALMKIEEASTQHGWRMLWALTNESRHYAVQQLQIYKPLAVTLGSGDTNDLATAGILNTTRLQVTTNSAGSALTGMVHNAFSTLNTTGNGEIKIVENMGPAPLTLGCLRGSAGANEFYFPNGIDAVLDVAGSATFIYDVTLAGGCWRCIGISATMNLGVGPRLATTTLAAGDTDNWNPTGFHRNQCVQVTCDATGSTLTGMSAGQEGEVKYLQVAYAGGAGALTLAEYRGSTGVNRFVLPGLVDKVIPPGGGVAMVYRTTDQAWLVLAS